MKIITFFFLSLTGYYISKMEVFFNSTLKNSEWSFGGRIESLLSKNYIAASFLKRSGYIKNITN